VRTGRGTAVVLCPPIGHEYVRAHRAFRQFASALAREGFAVMRFDYSGTGDSAGDPTDVGLPEWLRDVHAASQEARRRSGFERTAFVGARLGAVLAMLAAAREGPARDVVLWDPPPSGEAYLRELEETHLAHRRLLPGRTPPARRSGDAAEYMGYPYPASLLRHIGRLDLASLPRPAAGRTLLLETEPPDDASGLRTLCGDQSADMAYRAVPGPRVWATGEFRLLVPHRSVFDGITEWLSGRLR
jgi:uncharacterized protein